MPQVTTRDALSAAIRYWEPRRILYNCALLVVVALAYYTNLPSSASVLSFDSLQRFFVLAVLANVAYCAAYIVDVAAQISEFRAGWLRLRWALLVIGLIFAAVLANFFAHGLFARAT